MSEPEDESETSTDEELLPALREAIESTEVRPLYQPIVRLEDGAVFAYEALSRGPPGPLESPATLYRVASTSDLLAQLDEACVRAAVRGASGLPSGARLFVNVLPSALARPELRAEVFGEILAEAGIAPADFVLELTESVPLPERDVLRTSLKEFRELGAAIAIDDYGMGYANLESLLAIRPEFLKLDGSFTRGLPEDPLRQEVMRAMGALTRSYGAALIAEGVETSEQLEALKQLGVPYAQGKLLGEPGVAFPKAS